MAGISESTFKRVPQVMAVLASVLGLAFLLNFLWVYFPKVFLNTPPLLADLSGRWEICLPEKGRNTRPLVRNCQEWNSIQLPGDLPPNLAPSLKGWMILKTRFSSPERCRPDSGVRCSLLFGEVGDAVEARLNGVVLGRHGEFPPRARYAKQYPARFDLPPDLLAEVSERNELQLTIHSLKRPQSGLRKGPVAVVENREATDFVQGYVSRVVFFPLAGSLALFAMAFTGLLLSRKEALPGRDLVGTYLGYCFASGLFLLSFSEIPREYLPIWIAAHLHFFFRYFSDWAFFELVSKFFEIRREIVRVIRMLYAVALLAFVASFAYSLTLPESVRLADAGTFPYLITKKIFVIKALPMIFGLLGSIWLRRSKGVRTAFIALFSVLLFMQISDILVFLDVWSGSYFVKFYPVVVGTIFGGLMIHRYQALRTSQEKELAAKVAVGRVASQVAHDIRSPVAALDEILGTLEVLPEKKRIVVRQAISRIYDISNSLLDIHRNGVESVSNKCGRHLLPGIIHPLVTEKRTQYRSQLGVEIDFRIDAASYGLFAEVERVSLGRVISNLVDNAVQAVGGDGAVVLSLADRKDQVQISVEDNGCGLPPEMIERVLEGGVSLKSGGNGLGLASAKQTVESWGGSLEMESALGRGTRVSILLPKAAPPSWFVPALHLRGIRRVVILDDDVFIHRTWKEKFVTLEPDEAPELVHFSRAAEFESWIVEDRKPGTLFLIDYELIGESMTGLDLARKHGVLDHAILVTSRFDDTAVLSQVTEVGIGLIPKNLARFVPLRRDGFEILSEPDLVLIDNDPVTRESWSLMAEDQKKRILAFESEEEFSACGVARNVPIFVDLHLGAGRSGLTVAADLHRRGYEKLFITTGAARDRVEQPAYVRDVVGKRFPVGI